MLINLLIFVEKNSCSILMPKYMYGHLWYFRVNGVFVHLVFSGFENKLHCNILKFCLH